MKDLYRRNKLSPRENDPVKIHNCAGTEEEKEAAFHILLDAEKKAVYDRTHTTLKHIGYIRRQLGLAGVNNWRVRYADFLEPAHPAPLRKVRPRRRFSFPSLRLPRRLSALLTWPMALLAALALLPLVWLSLAQDDWSEVRPMMARPAMEIMHVASGRTAVHAQPDPAAAQVAELNEFEDVLMDPRLSGEAWAHVELGPNQVGYVLRQVLAPGSGELAQVAKCRRYGSWRPENGQHLGAGQTGVHHLVVNNPTTRDALVKLKDHEGNTEAFFYVRSGETARVDTIPEGRLQLSYAFGADFSAACGRFLEDMQAMQERRFITFTKGRGPTGVVQGEGAPAVEERTLSPTGRDIKPLANRDF